MKRRDFLAGADASPLIAPIRPDNNLPENTIITSSAGVRLTKDLDAKLYTLRLCPTKVNLLSFPSEFSPPTELSLTIETNEIGAGLISDFFNWMNRRHSATLELYKPGDTDYILDLLQRRPKYLQVTSVLPQGCFMKRNTLSSPFPKHGSVLNTNDLVQIPFLPAE